MKTIEKIYKEYNPPKELAEICEIESALFFDIETTGLNKATTSLYLIGCGYYKNNCLNTIFFFGEDPSEELEVLNAFFLFVTKYKLIIHFNGTKFDLPYLDFKAQKYNIENPLNNINSFDLYREIKPLRYLLFRESMRQKCVEDFLGIEREDIYNGGELIPVYMNYVETKDSSDFSKLMTHNIEDVLGMHKLFPILNYLKLNQIELNFISENVNIYKDINGNNKEELILDYNHQLKLPKSFSIICNNIYYKFDADDNSLKIRIPIINADMNYYYENHSDYCYLIEENKCIHKSLATGVDKKYIRKASKDECYVKVQGAFLPQFEKLFEKSFGDSYKTRNNYFMKPSDNIIENYTCYGYHLIHMLLSGVKKRHRKTII